MRKRRRVAGKNYTHEREREREREREHLFLIVCKKGFGL